MGRISSNPVILERLPKLRVSTIVAQYQPNTYLKGMVGTFETLLSFGATDGKVVFLFKEGKHQTIELVSVPSNLGKGLRWYFVCPITGKRATYLYLHKGIFIHRTGFDKAFYKKQTESQSSRTYRMIFDTLDQMEKETDPERFERIAERHDRYAKKLESRYEDKFIETVYDPKVRRIVSKTVNGIKVK